MMKSISGALCALLLGAAGAMAAPVTFTFTDSVAEAVTSTYDEGGLRLTVTAQAITEGGRLRPQRDSLVTMDVDGLGARNRVGTDKEERNRFVDGKSSRGINDLLMFEFDRRILSVVVGFSKRPGFDSPQFLPYVLGADGFEAVRPRLDVDGAGPMRVDAMGFGLAAIADGDQFKVASLTVRPAPIAVPIPASGGLALLGLLSLGLLRRR